MEVVLLSFLKRAAGEGRVEMEAATVGGLVAALAARYGEAFRRELLAPEGGLKAGMAVLVNGRNVIFLQGLATPLNPQDKVTFIPPVAGG